MCSINTSTINRSRKIFRQNKNRFTNLKNNKAMKIERNRGEVTEKDENMRIK